MITYWNHGGSFIGAGTSFIVVALRNRFGGGEIKSYGRFIISN